MGLKGLGSEREGLGTVLRACMWRGSDGLGVFMRAWRVDLMAWRVGLMAWELVSWPGSGSHGLGVGIRTWGVGMRAWGLGLMAWEWI